MNKPLAAGLGIGLARGVLAQKNGVKKLNSPLVGDRRELFNFSCFYLPILVAAKRSPRVLLLWRSKEEVKIRLAMGLRAFKSFRALKKEGFTLSKKLLTSPVPFASFGQPKEVQKGHL